MGGRMKKFKIPVTVLMIMALTFGLGGLSFLAIHKTRAVLMNNLEVHTTSLTHSLSSKVSLWLKAHESKLEIMANIPLMKSGDKDLILSYLNEEIQRNQGYEELFYADSEGKYLQNTGLQGSIIDRDYFNEVRDTGNSIISDPLYSKGSGRHIIVVAAPIKNGSKVVGLIGGCINLSELTELIAAKDGEVSKAFIVQKDGLMITHPNEEFIMTYNGRMYNRSSLDYKDTIDKMIKGESGITRNTFEDGDKYLAYAPILGVNWSLGVTVPASYVLNQLYYLPVYFVVVTVCLGLVLAFLMRRWLVRPLTKLARFTSELNDNIYGLENNYLVDSPVIEVESLATNFRRMAVELQDNFRKLANSEISLKEEIYNKMTVQKDLESSYEELEAVEEELRYNYEKLQSKEIMLRESERRLRSMLENVKLITGIIDMNGKIIFCNDFILGLTGYEKDEVVGHDFFNVFIPHEFRQKAKGWLKGVLASKDIVVHNIYPIRTKAGNNRFVHWNHTLLFDADGNVSGIASIGEDITERKQFQEKLEHISFHDVITDLYNRTYFEEKMRSIQGNDGNSPVGIIVCDVDGLKLVNDTLGHSTGDKLLWLTGTIIKKCFREEDLIFRIGGDEFAVILPKSDLTVVEKACYRIRKGVEKYNLENKEFPLSLSMGFAVSGTSNVNLDEVFKEADDGMYREKLHRSKSTRSAIVQAMMKALEARDFITEGHADRLQDLVIMLGEAITLSDRTLSDLRLLAQFHDIGKVGIPDRILFKAGRLTEDEFKEMQRHSEIGHRIAQSAPDLLPISDFILRHHEWWNGKGYPLGLKEEEIPLECRILAIADAYDAMTSNRPYRKGMSQEQALNELTKNQGIQFDPILVPIFNRMIRSGASMCQVRYIN
ncbi:PAS domain S-box-containing protein/diguanylate cyclase (GGDEF) domain-containing protein [Desulfosporosinus hippei DSM 8344]|uniref:PAS domain S-box-containing protein/diguanylate cyclase (GGDEF) domain-containing protein n=2 Tax=Desulfosporosinus TaxID=79206 RepID=A0A1G8LF02_9FIRM|nr:PAS domain S-box-containing protein/diguanylate cyclase (GGDEF) domain-containing protein [Desulfosporosinus hippei DSM 8344]